MKAIKLFLMMLLSIVIGLNKIAYASTHHPFSPESIKKERDEKLLMASDLPKQLVKHFNLTSPLSYVSGHESYDTAVVLMDDKGKKITLKHQLNRKKNYTLHTLGQTTLVQKNVWFFSPNGTEQSFENEYDLDKCTAESPCKTITQALVDGIHARAPAAYLWFASGTYALPVVQQKEYNPKLIEFHHYQQVSGRTSDFRHIAYDKERPLFTGTLSWTDYTSHYGAVAIVQNIIMRTAINDAQLDDYYFNTNLYSTNDLIVENSDLEITEGANINAEHTLVLESDLVALGLRARNITGNSIHVIGSNLKSSSTSIETALRTSDSLVFINNSKILVESDSASAIAISANGRIHIHSSNIVVKAFGEGGMAWGIEIPLPFVVSPQSILSVWNSHIIAFSKFNWAAAISSIDAKIDLSASVLSAQSERDGVTGIFSSDDVEFIEEPSYIKLSSPVFSEFFSGSGPGNKQVKVLNNSTPPSQCQMNNEKPQDCATS